MPHPLPSRREEARVAARELVELLESGAPVGVCLMKAQRMARLLRDPHAQRWLDLETTGYPKDLNLRAELGPCARYAWRVLPDPHGIYTNSLPSLEAELRASEAALSQLAQANLTSPVANFGQSAATNAMLSGIEKHNQGIRDRYTTAASTFARMKSHLHRYAADSLVALEFGEVAESIFVAARNRADEFVRNTAPKAAEQLLAAEERMADGTSESRSAALTSCRRLLCSVADSLFPPRDEPYVDGSGKPRKVGPDAYVNRLCAYIERAESRASSRAILGAQVGHLAARLTAVNDKASKGVHAEVTEAEARLVLLETYFLLSELAMLAAA